MRQIKLRVGEYQPQRYAGNFSWWAKYGHVQRPVRGQSIWPMLTSKLDVTRMIFWSTKASYERQAWHQSATTTVLLMTKYGPTRCCTLAVERHNRSRSSCECWQFLECFLRRILKLHREIAGKNVDAGCKQLRRSSYALLMLCLVHDVLGACGDGGSGISLATASRRCPWESLMASPPWNSC